MKLSPGEAALEALVREGVSCVFGVVGSSYAEVLDAFHDRDDIRFVGTRHEQGAAFMAVGWARATGRAGVCMATNGPGATNLLTGVAEAHLGHTPVVAMTGAVSRAHVYRGGIQEVDHLGVFRPVTKATLQVPRADRIPELVRQAFRTATTGQMGPVLLDVPRDLYREGAIDVGSAPPGSQPQQRIAGDPDRVATAVDLLLGAEFPLVAVGAGVKWSGADEEAGRIADALGAPLVTSYHHNDAVPNDHRLFLGALGRCGTPEAEEALGRADVILALGTRLGHFTTYFDTGRLSPGARIVQVDLEPRELGRVFPAEVAVAGDARTVARQLLELLDARGPRPGRETAVAAATELRERRARRIAAEAGLPDRPVKPQRVFAEMKKVVPDDALWVLDTAATPGYGNDRIEFREPGTLFGSLDLACVGTGFPMALGVKMARPDRPVICVSGDGGFLFNSQELETALREAIPFVTVVMTNNAWGAEKAYQKWIFQERYVGANITNPRLDAYAESFGARGFRVDRSEDVAPALQEALEADVASVVEVLVDPEEIPFPARAADIYTDWKPPEGEG